MENPHFRIVYVEKNAAMYLFWNYEQGIQNHSRPRSRSLDTAHKGLVQERRELEDMADDVARLIGGPWDAIGLHINFHVIGAYPDWLKDWNLDWTESGDWSLVGAFLIAGSGGMVKDSKAFHAKLKEYREGTQAVMDAYKCEIITVPDPTGSEPDSDWYAHLGEDFGCIC